MGKCFTCGTNTGGFWSGKYSFEGQEYCGGCIDAVKLNHKKKVYAISRKKFSVPDNPLKATFEKGFLEIPRGIFYDIWVKDDMLCLFPSSYWDSSSYEYECTQIPIRDIEYFATKGEIKSEMIITGGGGTVGGSSIGGAVVGGIIAGGVGAVIGSRKAGTIDPIKTEHLTKDERYSLLNVFLNNTRRTLRFRYDDYKVFYKLLPEKAFNNVKRPGRSYHVPEHPNKANMNKNNDDITHKIEKLAELKSKGLITEEEFNERKKQLLDKYI